MTRKISITTCLRIRKMHPRPTRSNSSKTKISNNLKRIIMIGIKRPMMKALKDLRKLPRKTNRSLPQSMKKLSKKRSLQLND